MDPRNGEILALGSYPSFDANEFAKPISQTRYNQLSSEELGAPLFNRAIAATYPTGSTFKPITAMAALEEGVITPDDARSSTTASSSSATACSRTPRTPSTGRSQLPGALTVSSDVFFYTLGADMNGRGPVLQEWAKRLGVGRRTGIDIPGEFAGLVPDSEWRNEGYKEYLRCAKKAKVPAGDDAGAVRVRRHRARVVGGRQRQPRGRPGRPPGDAAPAGHRLLDDHQRAARSCARTSGMQVEDGNGVMLEEIRTPARRRVSFDQAHRDAIMAGLHGAATADGGTSSDVFADFPYRDMLYGKTGTAERRRTPTSRGTSATWTTRRSRSWSSPRSSAAASARRLRHPRRASSSMSGSI